MLKLRRNRFNQSLADALNVRLHVLFVEQGQLPFRLLGSLPTQFHVLRFIVGVLRGNNASLGEYCDGRCEQ